MKNCPRCNRSFRDSFFFCLDDGSPLPSSESDPDNTVVISDINNVNPSSEEYLESNSLLNDSSPSPMGFFDTPISAFWRKKENSFWLYVNGIAVNNDKTPCAWRDNDLLVFETESKISYILKNFKHTPDNQLMRAEILQYQISAFWGKQDGQWSLYVNGVDITDDNTPHSWIDDDILVYDKKTKRTFIVRGARNVAENQLLPAEVL